MDKVKLLLQEIQGKISYARALHYNQQFADAQAELSEAFTLCEIALTKLKEKDQHVKTANS